MKKLSVTVISVLMLTVLTLFCGCNNNSSLPYNENLLENAGFENTDGDTCIAWTLDRYDSSAPAENCGSIEYSSAPQGNRVLSLSCDSFNDSRFIQKVTLDPDSYYKLSAKIKTEEISPRDSVTSSYYNSSGANISFLKTYCRSNFVGEYSDWTEVVLYAKTDKKTRSATVALRLGYYSSDCSGTVYFDDVCLEKIKEVPDGMDIGEISEVNFSSSSDTSETQSDDSEIKTSVVWRSVLYFAFLAIALFLALKHVNGFSPALAYVIIGICLAVRLIASVLYVGFKVDINCFAAWGYKMASNGPLNFYSSDYFCDYPPLYMFVVGLISLISPTASLTEGFGLMLLKLPAILCDIIAALLIVNKAKKYCGKNLAALLGALYAVMPTAILNSAVWGQVDSVLVLFMMLTFILTDEDKFGLSVFVFSLGLLFKPQAVLFGPVMLFAAAREFAVIYKAFKENRKKEAKKRLCFGFGGLFASVLLFVILSVLMQNGQEATWLWDKYMGTLSSYDYATLSSFGLMGLLGGQWVPSSSTAFWGISFSSLGSALTVAVIISAILLFLLAWRKQKGIIDSKFLWLLAAYILAGVVTVSTRTHERYIFPVILMLIMSYAHFKDKRLLYLSLGFGLVNFVNTATVLYLYEGCGIYMTKSEPLMLIGSASAVMLFILLASVAFDICRQKEKKKISEDFMTCENTVADENLHNKRLNKLFARKSFKLPKVTWKDLLICGIITALYACVAFTDLGDTKAPQTQWHTDTAGNVYALCDLGDVKTVDGISVNASSFGKLKVYTSLDGENYAYAGETVHSYNTYDEWVDGEISATDARYVKLIPQSDAEINEVILFSGEEILTPVEVKSQVAPNDAAFGDGNNLFDAQSSYSVSASYSRPETYWDGTGEYILTLEKSTEISEIYGYSVSADFSGTLEFLTPDGDVLAYLDLYGASWCAGEIMPGAFGTETDTVTVRINDGSVNIGELIFKDTDGKIINIKSAVSQDGGSESISNVFDEQEKYSEYLAVTNSADMGAKWTVSSVSDWVVADFGETKHVDRGYFYTSVCSGTFTVYYSNDGINWSDGEYHEVEPGQLYYWHGLPSDGKTYADLNTRYVAVCAANKNMRIIEMGFFENSGDESVIEIKNITSSNTGENGGANIFDEQNLVPTRPSYMNSMYFDEIYHARTAYENLNGLSIYEWTHPPLGKDIMSLSIKVFGMTPFGWRFAGTLAGVLMVPAMYFIGLLMFRKHSWASMLAVIMSLDGMHFVQTRLATIDSYGVLFIILMFLFMYWYYSISFYDTPIKKTFIPLGLCGLAFGLGAASKWICLYAGAGLAVIFFITLFRRFSEYKLAKASVTQAQGEEKKYLEHIIRVFPLYTAETILFCIGAFIIVPLIIYCASYYPYFNAEGETRAWYEIIIENQSAMFNYHSKLQATHPFQSDWYTWPVIYRPIYYYAGKELSDSSLVECISSFGNPLIWYMGLVATVMGLGLLIKRLFGGKFTAVKDYGTGKITSLFNAGDENLADAHERDTRLLLFLALGVACNLLPWVGISRCIFIYHYFATVPFIMMFTVYMFRNICRKNKKLGITLITVFTVASLILFIMFKPVWTGTAVSKDYVRTYLRWFKSWVFGV